MWMILISLAIGVVIGLLKFIPEKHMKYNAKFQQIGVILLLFSMGVSIGANKEIIYNLKDMGIQSAVFAVMTSLFSIFIVFVVSKKFLEGNRQ
ncbi:MAG: hypothetical protein PWP27_866 [Clostridiales bacterium]|jgi:uncharacterized membrane protein YbjE (DUF340 family)|nr:hypothetical protein [Clostridiales bacterium]MDK2933056.1 hypothetical protein [Clostridiales bacterium]